MIRKLFAFFLMILIQFNAGAQFIPDWAIPSGNFNQTAVMSTIDSEDNLIIAGYQQNENIYLRKIDLAGNLIWEQANSTSIAGKYQKSVWVNVDSEDNIIVVGKRYSITSVFEYPDAVVVLKYNPQGLLLWKQEIPVSVLVGTQHPVFNLRSETDQSGNIYIGCVAAEPSGFILIKINPDGNIRYVQNSTLLAPIGFSSMRLHHDRILMAGQHNTTAPVIVWDTAGSILWSVAATGRSAKDLEVDELGNVYVISNYPNQVSSGSGEDIVVSKYDESGNLLWKNVYDLGGIDFSSRCVLHAGRLSIAGYGTSNGSLYLDWKTIQTDLSGNLLWAQSYDETLFNDELPYFIEALADGGIVVTGKGGPSPDPNNLSYLQMVIVQYSQGGEASWTSTPNIYGGWGIACKLASDNSLFAISSANMTAYHFKPSLPTSIISNPSSTGMQIWPNPLSDHIFIQTEEAKLPIIASLFDLHGRFITEFILTQVENHFDLTSLKPGVYVVKMDSGENAQSIKIIKK